MTTINNTNMQCRKPQINFAASKPVKQKDILPKAVIDKFGLNMKSRIGYQGPSDYQEVPDNIEPGLKRYFKMLKVNWAAHIDPTKPRRSFE